MKRLYQAGWLPNYHGGWAMISLPPLLGIYHSGFVPTHLIFLLAWWAAYFLFFALIGFLRHGFAQRYRSALMTYGGLTLTATLILLIFRQKLIIWFMPLFLLTLLTLWQAKIGKERSLLSGIATVLLASLMLPIAYQVKNNDLPTHIIWLTVIIFLYFAGTVFYIKTNIRERKSLKYFYFSITFHAIALMIVSVYQQSNYFLMIVWILLLFRSILIPYLIKIGKNIAVKTIGILEILFSILLFLSLL